MNRFTAILCLAVALSATAAEVHKGTLVATTSVNNATTATAFSLSNVNTAMVQCDGAVYISVGATSGAAVATTTAGRKVAADEAFYFSLNNGKFVAALAVSGTVNCKVFAVY